MRKKISEQIIAFFILTFLFCYYLFYKSVLIPARIFLIFEPSHLTANFYKQLYLPKIWICFFFFCSIKLGSTPILSSQLIHPMSMYSQLPYISPTLWSICYTSFMHSDYCASYAHSTVNHTFSKLQHFTIRLNINNIQSTENLIWDQKKYIQNCMLQSIIQESDTI